MIVRRLKTDELYHHGIKGQKWGKRRYQNPDGTLTSEGYSHYKNGKFMSDKEYRNDGKLIKEEVKITPFTSSGGGGGLIKDEVKVTPSASSGYYNGDISDKRRKFYKEEALKSKMKEWASASKKKNVIHQMKVFGQAFKEVHTENLQKGANFVKKLLKK